MRHKLEIIYEYISILAFNYLLFLDRVTVKIILWIITRITRLNIKDQLIKALLNTINAKSNNPDKIVINLIYRNFEKIIKFWKLKYKSLIRKEKDWENK